MRAALRSFPPVLLLSVALLSPAGADVPWLPAGFPPAPAESPALCQGRFLIPEQGQASLDAVLKAYPDRASWEAYAAHLRERVQSGADLKPWPRRTPLNPVIRSRRMHDGYSVENVAFESIPGYFVTGNLYRPLAVKDPCPGVLSTHGHSGIPTTPAGFPDHGRFRDAMQLRCGSLARMGAVVLSIDMFAHGDSIAVFEPDAYKQPLALTIQIWNAIRAVDGIDESHATVEPTTVMHVFNDEHPLPARALRTAEDVRSALQSLQQ